MGPTWLYCSTTGCTGTPARKAPVLNGSRPLPLVVVPCVGLGSTERVQSVLERGPIKGPAHASPAARKA